MPNCVLLRVCSPLLATLLLSIACGKDGPTDPPAQAPNPPARVPVPTRVEVAAPDSSLSSLELEIGATARVFDDLGAQMSGVIVTWSSSAPAVATVSSAGTIRSKGVGNALIQASVGALQASFPLTVEQLPAQLIASAPSPQILGLGVAIVLSSSVRDANGIPIPGQLVTWRSTDPTVARITGSNTVFSVKAGATKVIAQSGSLADTVDLSVVAFRDLAVESYLATPIAGATWTVPVTVLAYLPTADGVNIDVRKCPDFYDLGPLSLAAVEGRILDIVRRKKMSLEQGSRFRGYSNPGALPSIGIRVVRIRFVYDILPASATFRINGIALPDYSSIVPQQGLDTLINSAGVRQVWLAQSSLDAGYPSYNPAIHSAADFRVVDESNMSSALTGDISNSYRLNDLPILSQPYIVYGINWRRSQAEAVHNVGHQLEAQYTYIAQRQDGNTQLFWRQFVGQNASNQFVTGRAGWTHMPPNTVKDYDYLNSASVASDIEDWSPDNSGAKKNVSVSTWANHAHPWPGAQGFGQQTESQWYIYWFQSMPGRGNTIRHGAGWMTNWWAFTGDWHGAVNANLGLHAAAPAASRGVLSAAKSRVVDPAESRLLDPRDAAEEAARWPVREPWASRP